MNKNWTLYEGQLFLVQSPLFSLAKPSELLKSLTVGDGNIRFLVFMTGDRLGKELTKQTIKQVSSKPQTNKKITARKHRDFLNIQLFFQEKLCL